MSNNTIHIIGIGVGYVSTITPPVVFTCLYGDCDYIDDYFE